MPSCAGDDREPGFCAAVAEGAGESEPLLVISRFRRWRSRGPATACGPAPKRTGGVCRPSRSSTEPDTPVGASERAPGDRQPLHLDRQWPPRERGPRVDRLPRRSIQGPLISFGDIPTGPWPSRRAEVARQPRHRMASVVSGCGLPGLPATSTRGRLPARRRIQATSPSASTAVVSPNATGYTGPLPALRRATPQTVMDHVNQPCRRRGAPARPLSRLHRRQTPRSVPGPLTLFSIVFCGGVSRVFSSGCSVPDQLSARRCAKPGTSSGLRREGTAVTQVGSGSGFRSLSTSPQPPRPARRGKTPRPCPS